MVVYWAEQMEMNSVENWGDSKVASMVDVKVRCLADLSDWWADCLVDLLVGWVGWMVESWVDVMESL